MLVLMFGPLYAREMQPISKESCRIITLKAFGLNTLGSLLLWPGEPDQLLMPGREPGCVQAGQDPKCNERKK